MTAKQIQEFKETEIGKIPVDWNYEILDNFLERITYGFTCPMPTSNDGPYMITATDLKNNKINFETARKTTLDAFDNSLTDKSRPKINDILLSKDGTLGRVAIVNEEKICINQSVALLQPNTRIFPNFLYYLLMTPVYQKKMISDSDGSTIQHIYITRVNKMYVAVPEINEQKRIAQYISKIDTKIKNLHNQNKILEQTAQAIFKSWFVDFDGVTEFEDSELGQIPKGWKVDFFGNMCSIVDFGSSGSFASLKKNIVFYYYPEYAILVRSVDFNRNWNEDYVYTDKHGYDFSKRANLKPGDLMLSNIGSPGIPFFVPDLGKHMTCGKNVLFIKMDDFKKYFLYYYLTSDIGQNTIRTILTGSTVPKFNKTDLKNTQIIFPPDNSIIKFHKIIFPLRETIQKNQYQINSLTKTCDALLPKLMSGEIRV